MKIFSTKNNKILFNSLGIITLLFIWFILSMIIDNNLILPKIDDTVKNFIDLLSNPSTYKIIFYTLLRITISLIIGVFIGISLGTLSKVQPWFNDFISPLIKIMRALPIASIILIILILFGMKGFDDLTFSPIIVSILLIIPIVYEAVYKGLKSIDKDLIDVARLETNNTNTLVFKSFLPLIKKEITISLSQSIGLSFKSMVMAEYISQTQTSIGIELLTAKSYLDYESVFSWTIILIILSIVFEVISKKLISKWI